jgi:hypothetical protein
MTSGQDGDGADMPGVGHPEDLGDGALAIQHQLVHLAQHVADLGQVILCGQPGAGEEPVIVGAALAVDEDELDGGGGVGLSYDGNIVTGWSSMAKSEEEARKLVEELKEHDASGSQ